MTLDSIGSLLASICVHWPVQKKNYINADTGNVSKTVAEEWYRRIGYLDDEKVEAMFTEYLADENVNKYPPGVGYFLGHRSQRASSSYMATEARQKVRFRVKTFTRKDKSGKEIIITELVDDEGRVYADPDDPDGVWYINGSGYICKRDNEREEVWYR